MGSNLFHHNKIANQKGISLIEILVAIGIAGFVALGNMVFLNDFLQRLKAYETSSDEETEIALTNTVTTNILKKAHLSLNRIQLKDDKGNSFFDYYPDLPSTAIQNGSRLFSLNSNHIDTKYFYLLTTEETEHDSIIFDPVHAYAEVSTPSDLLSDGKIIYRGINSVPSMKAEDGTAAKDKLMEKIFKTRWAKGEIYVLTCPTYLRPIINKSLNLLSPPRPATYIGNVSGDDLIQLPSIGANVSLMNSHPVTQSSYKNLDQFFRSLPTIGGAAPFVKVEPAKLVRIGLRKNSAYQNGYSDLIMSVWKNGAFTGATIVATKVKQANFSRTTVTMPIISLEIIK